MNKLGFGLGVVALAVLGGGIYLQQRSLSALRREVVGLREDVRRAMLVSGAQPANAVGAAANGGVVVQPLRPEEKDLAAMVVAEAAANRPNPAAPEAGRSTKKSEASTAAGAVPTGVMSAGDLKNLGRAAPEAGTVTALWAAVNGEVDALAGALLMPPALKEKADEWFAGLPDARRRELISPERVVASVIAREASALSSLQIVGRHELAPDQVEVQVRLGGADGNGKDETFLMRRASGGWGLELPEETVRKLVKRFIEESR